MPNETKLASHSEEFYDEDETSGYVVVGGGGGAASSPGTGAAAAASSPSSGSSAAAEAGSAPKTFLLTLFGTDDSIEGQAKGKAQVHTLAIPMMGITGKPAAELKSGEIIPGIDPSVNTLALAGPKIDARNVHQIIAKAALECLRQLAAGVETIHINGHSRGACSAIYLSNVLAQVQQNISAAAPQTLAVVELFKGCNPDVVKAVQTFSQEERYKSLAVSKQHFDNLKLNIFAIDPVPGNMAGYKAGIGFWNDDELRTLPPLVASYTQIEMMHENSWFFNSLVPKAKNKALTRRQIIRLPGNHCNPCGKLHFQQGAETDGVMLPPPVITQSIAAAQTALTKAISQQKAETVTDPLKQAVETAKAPLHALAAQHHLTIFNMLDAMEISGLAYDYSGISERDDVHADWHGCLPPLKDVISQYTQASPEKKDLLKLACYDQLKAGEAFFEQQIAKNYYAWIGGNRLVSLEDAYRQTHKISGKGSARAFYSTWTFKSPKMGSFISMEHLVLHMKDAFRKDDALREHVHLVEALLKTKNSAGHGATHLPTSELCDNILKVVNAAADHYKTKGDQNGLNNTIISSTNIIISLLISKLMTPGLNIDELNILINALTKLQIIIQGKSIPVNVFTLVFAEFNSKVNGDYFDADKVQKDINNQFPTQTDSRPLHNVEKTVKHLEFLNARYMELNHLKNVYRKLNKNHLAPDHKEILSKMQEKLDDLTDSIIATFRANKNLLDQFVANPAEMIATPVVDSRADAGGSAAAGGAAAAAAEPRDLTVRSTDSPTPGTPTSESPSSAEARSINIEIAERISADIILIRSMVSKIACTVSPDLFNLLKAEDEQKAAERITAIRQAHQTTHDEADERAIISALEAQERITVIQQLHQTELAGVNRHAEESLNAARLAHENELEAAKQRAEENLTAIRQAHQAEITTINADILEYQHQIKIINMRAIKIGATIGLVVTAVVAGTLCLYLFAPAIVPVLLAQAILTTTGIGSMLTPLVAIKALVIATGAGLITGLSTKEVVSVCSKKPILNVVSSVQPDSNYQDEPEIGQTALPEVPTHTPV